MRKNFFFLKKKRFSEKGKIFLSFFFLEKKGGKQKKKLFLNISRIQKRNGTLLFYQKKEICEQKS
jgi:hypothetical protein